MAEPMSLVKACQDFFSKEPYGRKIDIPEFKALSEKDKDELKEMLIAEGYNITS